jgi:hypothetical protein
VLPSQLAVEPKRLKVDVPPYDFDNQIRWDGIQIMGKWTSASTQTFDSQGRPKDSQSDHTDS